MRKLLQALILAIALCSCSVKDSVNQFLKTSEAENGVYVFDVDMSDPEAVYDFAFFSRSRKTLHNVQLKVRWLSPSGDGMAETVYMKTVTSRGTRETYRTGVQPEECGTWKLSVMPLDEGGDLLGLGLISNKTNGTR